MTSSAILSCYSSLESSITLSSSVTLFLSLSLSLGRGRREKNKKRRCKKDGKTMHAKQGESKLHVGEGRRKITWRKREEKDGKKKKKSIEESKRRGSDEKERREIPFSHFLESSNEQQLFPFHGPLDLFPSISLPFLFPPFLLPLFSSSLIFMFPFLPYFLLHSFLHSLI